MAKTLLTSDQVVGVHDYLATRRSALSAVIDGAKPGDTWTVPVTPETVFFLEGLFRLASDLSVNAVLMPEVGLDPREAEFVADFKHFFLDSKPPSEANPSSVGSDGFALLQHGFGSLFLRGTKLVPVPAEIKSATLIGAYGGEHVGDAAILGGVLLGLHRDFGTTRATVMSKRPNHTKRLAAKLETPVTLTVLPYGHSQVANAIAENDALVFAGGPLMDLPRMLVMHLKSARLAVAAGKPFLVRNVGVGPFKRPASKWIARQIARHASQFSVRTNKAAQDAILAGMDIGLGHDPAFDYLASRENLTLLSKGERATVDRLLAGTKGATLIGLNIRPIRHDWSKMGSDFSKQAEVEFFEACSNAMEKITSQSTKPVVFVFFPMNPIQLGGSDLESAYRLQKLVQGRVDMRVLQADPDVDGVLYLLRKLDAAVTMRFHASIFCLSQAMGTVGVDYYPGQGGKVEQLFTDLGKSQLVRRMDEIQAAWLAESIQAVTGKPKTSSDV